MERKIEIKTFLYCPEKRGEKIKLYDIGKIEWQKGRKRSRTEVRMLSYIDKETRPKEMVQKQNKV